MLDEHDLKKVRRSTKSCTECRRRKVRCIRVSEDAPCRGCEDRGTSCIAQPKTSRPLNSQRLPSRFRINQLESEVSALRKSVRDIQSKLGYQQIQSASPTIGRSGSTAEFDQSDDASSDSEVLRAEQPSHLRSLFQNEWFSVENRERTKQVPDRKTKASEQLLRVARLAIQKLIPSKDDVMNLTSTGAQWLVLHHSVLPPPFAVQSQTEILTMYNTMHDPEVDTFILASWLMDIAVTALQDPPRALDASTKYSVSQNISAFARDVLDTVERTMIFQDRLLGTVSGLGMAIHFLRLVMSQGNMQKAWIRLRHFIALAELMGFQRTVQALCPNITPNIPKDETMIQKAHIWQLLSSADGLYGMMLNLPSGIRVRHSTAHLPLLVNGKVQPRMYLNRLAEITTKIQYIDDLKATKGLSPDLLRSALSADEDLKALASQTPESWWNYDTGYIEADHVVQNMHYYITIRVHLPFAIQQNAGEEYTYNRIACMNACESVIQRYQMLRRLLPPGFFLCRVLDIQALSAGIVLLFTCCNQPTRDLNEVQMQKARIKGILAQVVQVMEEKSANGPGMNFAQHGATTIRSLVNLLEQEPENSKERQLNLMVPLLGSVHIKRNAKQVKQSTATLWNSQSSQIPTSSNLWSGNEQVMSLYQGNMNFNLETQLGNTPQIQEQWQWNPLSWSIDVAEKDLFQDVFMDDTFEQVDNMQTGYDDFQLS